MNMVESGAQPDKNESYFVDNVMDTLETPRLLSDIEIDANEDEKSYFIDDMDIEIQNYKSHHLTDIIITTSTIAYSTNLNVDYHVLSNYVKKDGITILTIKSADKDLQELLNDEQSGAKSIIKKRERNNIKKEELHGKPNRTLSGNGLFFQSAVEFVVSDDNGGKHNVRISPAGGSIQVQGVKQPIFLTARKQITKTLNYIEQFLPNLSEKKYKFKNCRVIIINIKTIIISPYIKLMYNKYKSNITYEEYLSTVNIKIDVFAKLMRDLMEKQKQYPDFTDKSVWTINIPYKIVFVTDPFEAGSYIRIKFLTPIESNVKRKSTIKIFEGRKINILGCPTPSCPYYIYKFIDNFIELYKDQLFHYKLPKIFIMNDLIKYTSDLNKHEFTWVKMINKQLSV